MMATKKTAKKTTAPEPATPAVLLPITAEWDGPSAWKSKSLGWRMTNANIVDDEKLADVMSDEDSLIEDVADAWLRNRLKEEERAQVAEFVRVISWLDHVADSGATPAQLTLPDCLLPIIAEPLNTTEKLQKVFFDQVIPTPEAITEPVTTEPVTTATEAPAASVDHSPAVPDADGQLSLVKEPEKPNVMKTLKFRSADEVMAVRYALEDSLKSYEKLAKESDAMGEAAAAKIFRDKALLLRQQLLPQVNAQLKLPFNEQQSLPSLVANSVAREVRARARASLMKNITQRKGESSADAEKRQLEKLDDLETLIGNIAENVGSLATKYISAAADRGIDAGKKALQADSATVAREAVQLVDYQLQESAA